MFLLPTILTLRYSRIHVSILYHNDISSYIKTSVNKGLSLFSFVIEVSVPDKEANSIKRSSNIVSINF